MKHKIGNASDFVLPILLYINPRYGDIVIMAKSNFLEKISCSTQESQVQETYNEMFKSVFKINTVDRKCQCDGYIDTRFDDTDISMLIEYKYDIRMKDKIERARVIAQCVGYLHKFEESGMALPKLVFIGDINECMIIHTNDLIKFLDLDCVNWDIAPCNLGQENNLIMPIVKSINPWVYDVDNNFKFDDIANKIISLCKGINQQVHITEKNIEKIFNNFCKRVLKNSNNMSANDLVAVFIGAMLDQEHYYKHPTKKNTLIANGTNIAINGDEYDAFMNQHSTDYSPKEKRIMTAISDRLIEDTNRRNKGEFYTPTLFVDYAHKMIEKELGSHWKENYVVWDCCCGTKNLTRDYRFKELYCSTLEQAELDISKNYNKEATSFQFDFLNDSLDDLKVKAPGLIEAFELNKPICFFINPPYGTTTSFKGLATVGVSRTVISNQIKLKEFIAQFLYRIYLLQSQFNITNVKICIFHQPKWLCGQNYKNFRKVFFENFEYLSGCMFRASEFANVSSSWGICFSIFNSCKSSDNSIFKHTLIESTPDYSIREVGDKLLYNNDNHVFSVAKFVERNRKTNANVLAVLMCPGNDVQNNGATFINSNCSYNAGGSHFITESNYEDCVSVLAARNLISTNWVIDKDEYMQPNENIPEYKQYIKDAVVYTIFGNQKSYRGENGYNNEFFWMSKQEMLDLAEKYNNDYTYEDALNSEERFVYLKLQEIKDDLSLEAKAVLDKAIDLVKSSFQYREMFNESHPEYQINNWDCGFYQIKELLKEFMPNELKTFRTLHKQLGDKIRQQVYELGFLK